MVPTKEALNQGFPEDEFGHVFNFTDGPDDNLNHYELRFERLLFDGQMCVALYKNKDLMTTKVVVKPGL